MFSGFFRALSREDSFLLCESVAQIKLARLFLRRSFFSLLHVSVSATAFLGLLHGFLIAPLVPLASFRVIRLQARKEKK